MSHKEPKVGILNLQMGNIGSVRHAVDYCGVDAQIIDYQYLDKGWDDTITHLILPGVGNFAEASRRLHSSNLRQAIQQWVKSNRPLLGICLGMQLLCEGSEEIKSNVAKEVIPASTHRETRSQTVELAPGLGVIPGTIRKLKGELRLPHIGWNQVDFKQAHPLLSGLKTDKDYYFVHSYSLLQAEAATVIGTTEYNQPFAAIVASGSAIGVQFHPEKSQRNGLQLLENFCHWDGE